MIFYNAELNELVENNELSELFKKLLINIFI